MKLGLSCGDKKGRSEETAQRDALTEVLHSDFSPFLG
jgi:hypothetical protein